MQLLDIGAVGGNLMALEEDGGKAYRRKGGDGGPDLLRMPGGATTPRRTGEVRFGHMEEGGTSSMSIYSVSAKL
ncbi:MAG: hypothetical protein ACE5LS_00175 [Thermoplasmata archaeon]